MSKHTHTHTRTDIDNTHIQAEHIHSPQTIDPISKHSASAQTQTEHARLTSQQLDADTRTSNRTENRTRWLKTQNMCRPDMNIAKTAQDSTEGQGWWSLAVKFYWGGNISLSHVFATSWIMLPAIVLEAHI